MPPKPHKPYNGLPDLPPPIDIETKAILKRCVPARAAIAELRLAGELIPDQSVLINTIPLLETKDSLKIENIITTNDALFRAASLPDDHSDSNTKEAKLYRSALYSGLQSLKQRPLTTRTVIEVCSTIKGVDMDVRKTPGTALQNKETGEIIYTPPEGEHLLREKLKNWETFLNDDNDIDPLVRMAVLHYQFEAIHPFIDGNGRTGRVLNLLYLTQAGLLDIPTLYLSRYILKTKADYFSQLANVTYKAEWEAWIIYMLGAVETTANWTNQRIRAIRSLMDHTTEHIKTHASKVYSHELIKIVFAHPYIRISHLINQGIAKRVAASRYLKQLATIGVLEEEKVGRDKFFVHKKYMALLVSDEHTFEPYPKLATNKPAAKKKQKRQNKS